MSKKNCFYRVVTCTKRGEISTVLKNFKSLQGARGFMKKNADSITWGIPFKKGEALRIYKIDRDLGHPVIIYLN